MIGRVGVPSNGIAGLFSVGLTSFIAFSSEPLLGYGSRGKPGPWDVLPCGGVVALVLGKHRPHDARVLVGDRDQGLLIATATVEFDDPSLQPAGSRRLRLQGRLKSASGTLDQERPQIDIAAQADAPQSSLATLAALSGRQSQPSAELPAALEGRRIGHCRRQRARGDWADAQ